MPWLWTTMQVNPVPPPHPPLSCKTRGNSVPFKIQFMWRGLMKKSSQALPSSPASFFLSAVPDCPAGEHRRLRRWGQNHQLLGATIILLASSCLLYPVYSGRWCFSLESLSAASPKSSFPIATSFDRLGHMRPECPCKAEPWFCTRSCGLLLLCRYLVWTSSSRSQLGRGWPIL